MKKTVTSSLLVGMMFLAGCGGATVQTGTAYYLDSAVAGVRYECGSQNGQTGPDGSFTFEQGKGCTFYLGEMKLREVDAQLLIDGQAFYETDYSIGQLLQSLDSQGSLDDGIQIDPEEVKELKGTFGIDQSFDNILTSLGWNNEQMISEDKAAEHILTTLLAGKTFYRIDANATTVEVVFDKNMEHITINGTRLDMALSGGTVVIADGATHYTLAEVNSDYVAVEACNEGVFEGEIKLFFSKENAEKYAQSTETNSSIPITEEMLLDKTFYHAERNADCTKTYRKFVFFKNENDELTVDLHFMVLKPDGSVAKEGRPKLACNLSQTGELQIDITPILPEGKTGYYYFTLNEDEGYKWHLTKKIDYMQDGEIDATFHPVWHTSRPDNTPDSL